MFKGATTLNGAATLSGGASVSNGLTVTDDTTTDNLIVGGDAVSGDTSHHTHRL